jgi:hypothetical protein
VAEQAHRAALAQAGFAFVTGAEMRRALVAHGSLDDLDVFRESWSRLALDGHMADGGRYRRRRHAVFTSAPGGRIAQAEHQPHYQSLDYNALNGGVARWFEPMEPAAAASRSFHTVLAYGRALFEPLRPDVARWKIEVHQFRIEAGPHVAGQPTPEGVHRDGVDYVLVLLVERRNLERGVTTIHDLARREIGSFTLTDPLDAALVDDARAFHGVTPVEAVDPGLPATRDVLVVTWKHDS